MKKILLICLMQATNIFGQNQQPILKFISSHGDSLILNVDDIITIDTVQNIVEVSNSVALALNGTKYLTGRISVCDSRQNWVEIYLHGHRSSALPDSTKNYIYNNGRFGIIVNENQFYVFGNIWKRLAKQLYR